MNSNFSLLFTCVLDCNCFQDFHKRHRETVQAYCLYSGKIIVQTDTVMLMQALSFTVSGRGCTTCGVFCV